ncbi:unnamed protein product [Linum trigynum]|uniref:Dof-type domain-containing protein n=1 Tax=Linum trigynum TaxID=586398 RepID=A0AAV2DGH7_9ROSI
MTDFKLFGQMIPRPLRNQLQQQQQGNLGQRMEVVDVSASCSYAGDPSPAAAAAEIGNRDERCDGDKDEDDCTSSGSEGEGGGDERDENMENSGNDEITDENRPIGASNGNSKDPNPASSSSSAGINQRDNTAATNTDKPGQDKGGKSDQSGEATSSSSQNQDNKTLKKPDKILPCPRCNSMETKFCYYNNYNVNQPRHFCKNCQRYWTAGGTMRNVPVGAGRRKNKSASSSQQYRQIMVSEALRSAAAQSHVLSGSTTVLNFRSDSPLCESVASILNLSENAQAGFHPRGAPSGAANGNDNGDGCSSGMSVTGSTNSSDKTGIIKHGSSGGSCLPCMPAAPWPYPMATPMPPPPLMGFGPPGFPISFYPASPYWGCAVPSPWTGAPPPQQPCPSSLSPNGSSSGSSPVTSPLGKHSRDGETTRAEGSSDEPLRKMSNGIVVPKTLRIDDPNDAAKSSIWATLGISQSEKPSSINGGSMFKGFQAKGGDRIQGNGTSLTLQANPAALSRSLNFQERN